MDEAEEEELYPPSESTEQAWAWLRQHLEWAEGFWLVLVFTESPPQAHVLQRRLGEWLGEQGKEQRIIQPDSPEELRAALELLDAPGEAACTWLEAVCRDPLHLDEEGEPWTEAWEHLLLRANERRERLREQGRGLVLVARSALKPLFREAAPDLWSVHTKVLELGWSRSPALEAMIRAGAREGLGIERLRDTSNRAFESLEHMVPAGALERAKNMIARVRGEDSDIDEAIATSSWTEEPEDVAAEMLLQYFLGLTLAFEFLDAGRFEDAARILHPIRAMIPTSGGAAPMLDVMSVVAESAFVVALILNREYDEAERAALFASRRVRDELGAVEEGLRILRLGLGSTYWALGRRYEANRIVEATTD